MKDIYMVTKYTNVYYIYDQSDPWVAHMAVRVRSKRQDEQNKQHIITEAVPNELELGGA